MTIQECRRFLEQGQFPAGSMGPENESAVKFLESEGDNVIITSLEMVRMPWREKLEPESSDD